MQTAPKFSIVMASRLAPYQGAASNREGKLIRAIRSALAQNHNSFELIVIADGCERTGELISEHIDKDRRLRLLNIAHEGLWSGAPRNAGIEAAKGTYITYLDIDDLLGADHLKLIERGINKAEAQGESPKWVYFNDYLANPKRKEDGSIDFVERNCIIDQKGHNGTANICHQRVLPVRWPWKGTYKHDWDFIRLLYYQKPRAWINTPKYFVCHLPGIVDV